MEYYLPVNITSMSMGHCLALPGEPAAITNATGHDQHIVTEPEAAIPLSFVAARVAAEHHASPIWERHAVKRDCRLLTPDARQDHHLTSPPSPVSSLLPPAVGSVARCLFGGKDSSPMA